MLTEVRQRVTRDLLGRRGTVADPIWVNRRLLLTGAEHLSAKQWKRLGQMLDHCDPTKEIGAAWLSRNVSGCCLPSANRPGSGGAGAEFYEAAIGANMDETTRLARTIQTWWPALLPIDVISLS